MYLLIGHMSKNLLPKGGFVVGGTVIQAAVVAKRLGWRPVVVTAAAPDFKLPASMALQRPGPGGAPSRIEVEEYVGLLRS